MEHILVSAQDDVMTLYTKDIKTPLSKQQKVVSLKVPGWFYESIEAFRGKYDMETRNAALSVLIAAGLERYGIIEKEQCQKFISTQGADRRFRGQK